MGLFGWLKKAGSAVVSAAKTAAKAAAETLDRAVNWAVDKVSGALSSHGKYTASKTENIINVERELNSFRASIREAADEAEKAAIDEAMEHFDAFAEDLEGCFPELVEVVRIRKKQARDNLANTIIDYVQECVSENDMSFQTILKMEKGPEKKKAIETQTKKIIQEAKVEFRIKLKRELETLNQDLDDRLRQKIDAEEAMLNSIAQKYAQLEAQTSTNTLDFEKLEDECVPVIEAASCIQSLLRGEVDRT